MITVVAVVGIGLSLGLVALSSIRHARNHPRRIVQPPGWDPEGTRWCLTLDLIGIVLFTFGSSALRDLAGWWTVPVGIAALWACGLIPIWRHNRALRKVAGQPV